MSAAAIIQAFEDAAFDWSVIEGTIRGGDGRRAVYLSSDIVRGIYTALEYETGEAWRLVLKSCGRRWGRRVARKLDQLAESRSEGPLSVRDWTATVERWFKLSGWGTLSIDLDCALRDGVVKVTLADSLFAEVLDDVEGPVDALVAGLLQALFSDISGQTLDCLEVADDTASESIFFVSGAERIADAETRSPDGLTLPAAMQALGVAG